MPQKKVKSHAVPAEKHAMLPVQRVAFHEDELDTVVDEQTGKKYVLPKRFCEIFKVSWQGQLAKLTRNKLFNQGIKKICIPSAGGEQETVILELKFLSVWLLSISPERVAPELQDKLLRYQEECADALHAYFTKGIAVNTRTQGDLLVEMAIANRDKERRIAALETERAAIQAEQLRQQEVLIAQQAQLIETLRAVQHVNTKADIAIEATGYMTIEEFILTNGLWHQCPPSEWREMATWLLQFCQQHGLPIHKTPVFGKAWLHENSYPVSVIKLWLDKYQHRWRQIPLVEDEAVAYSVAL